MFPRAQSMFSQQTSNRVVRSVRGSSIHLPATSKQRYQITRIRRSQTFALLNSRRKERQTIQCEKCRILLVVQLIHHQITRLAHSLYLLHYCDRRRLETPMPCSCCLSSSSLSKAPINSLTFAFFENTVRERLDSCRMSSRSHLCISVKVLRTPAFIKAEVTSSN